MGEGGSLRVWFGACLSGPCWNKQAVPVHQLGNTAPELTGGISSWAQQLPGVLRVEGRDNSKEELLWFIKCSYITVSNELPVRHHARFELMGTLITSRYKCSCVVKTWRCHTAFWTRSSVLQQSSSFSLLSHLQDYIFLFLQSQAAGNIRHCFHLHDTKLNLQRETMLGRSEFRQLKKLKDKNVNFS